MTALAGLATAGSAATRALNDATAVNGCQFEDENGTAVPVACALALPGTDDPVELEWFILHRGLANE